MTLADIASTDYAEFHWKTPDVGMLFRLLRNYLPIAIALLLLLPVSAISIIALVWPTDHEVLWHGSWVLKQCGMSGSDEGLNCIGQYEISFGNTGDHSEQVEIDWPVDLRRWSMDWKVLNISADRQRSNDPEFTCPQKKAQNAKCSIKDFAAGTLLIVKLRCLICNQTELQALEQNPPVVTSQARVYSSDPRATLLFRRLGVFFGWL